ncbi:hypothetical protein A2U01_0082597, partial [Trifolium medium]|nr:hypothetical protein [Trifolium medium]
PPQSTLLCLLSPGEDLESSGEVRATWSPELARCRQRRPNILSISRCLSPGEGR